MSRLFSTTVRTLLEWTGFDRHRLSDTWKAAVEKFTQPGGDAESRLGKIHSVNIKQVFAGLAMVPI
ncbi:uncharacterized protein BO87DRAFT_422614 [Aspergillus neoniger CBS 115656]|uniref:Uncharacterized protein n=1 Tax=Aspergillus neoniger (strain CBS 115656) TaxID=1448310 RepID=A0A318YTL7_ASPNB|nr:hypothetical protein BO87DRAFT_422614 [Aspergillus neoniger CBS 115656]PYH37739.1 hypothetical protein BO87DRAFT_422614 [Aspergillus neoniger CBS 115656]